MGVGFAKDAESQNKQNRSLQNRLREKYFKDQKYNPKRTKTLNYKQASEEELNLILTKLQKQKRQERIRIAVVLILIAIIGILYLTN